MTRMTRWIITEGEDIGNGTTIAYFLRRQGAPELPEVEVWWSPELERANCSKCVGPLQAMSASCKHARALRRHMLKAPKEKKPQHLAGLALRDKRIEDVYKGLAERYQRIEPLYIRAVTILGWLAGKGKLSPEDRKIAKQALDDCAAAIPGHEVVPSATALGWSLIPKTD